MDTKSFYKESRNLFFFLFCLLLLFFNFFTINAQTFLSENIKFSNNNTGIRTKLSDVLNHKEVEISELKSTLEDRLRRIEVIESQILKFKKEYDLNNKMTKADNVYVVKIVHLPIKPRIKKKTVNSVNTTEIFRKLDEKDNQIRELKKALDEREKRIEAITDKIAELKYGIILKNSKVDQGHFVKNNEILFRDKKRVIEYGRIHGQIVDAETGWPLKYAMIILNEKERGCLTDSLGRFTFTNLKFGLYQITAKLIGYSDGYLKNIPVYNRYDRNYKIKLCRKPIDLQTVTVYAYKESSNRDEVLDSGLSQLLEYGYIAQTPGAFNDIFRSFSLSSSVHQTNDINGLLYIRGGSADQNLVLMDGFEVYYPYRMRIAMGGGVSAFNSEIVKSVELIPGGFSAQYGNYLSSVLKVKIAGDNYQKKSFRLNLNLLSISSALQLPLNGNKGSVLLSSRRTVLGTIANTLLKHNYVLPSFNDFFSKISYNFSPNNKIVVNLLHASEGTKGTPITREQMSVINRTKNDNFGLHWQFVLNPKTIFTSNLSYYLDNNFLQFNDINTDQYNADLNYNIKKICFKYNLQNTLRPFIKIDLGTNVELNDYRLNWLLNWRSPIHVPLKIDLNSNSMIIGNYLQFLFLLSNQLSMKIGLRQDYSTLNKQKLFSPRINLSYQYASDIRIFAAYGDFYQFPNLLSSITRGEPFDISHNISSLKAEKATHYILGGEIDFLNSYRLKISGYYKNYNYLLVPENYTTFAASNLGKGFSEGLEFSLGNKLKFKKSVNWQLNYAFSKSRYNSDNHSSWLPFKWDQPHSLNALLNFNISKNCYLGFRWNYNSGLPSYFKDDQNNFNFGRFPAYNRLDLKFGYSFGTKIRYLFYLDMINLTNKKNIYANNWDFNDSQIDAQNQQTPIYMMPFLLSVGVKLEL